jgi:hypothetical protein
VIAGIHDVVPTCSTEHAIAKKREFRCERMRLFGKSMRENAPGFIGGHSDGIVEVTSSIPVGSTN